jgi:hypothetical protein
MIRRLVLLMAIPWIAGFADAKDLHWKDLPRYLNNKNVTVQDDKGMNYSGRFVATSPDAIVIANQSPIEIPRTSIVSITRYASQPSHAEAFGSHLFDFALSPFAIVTVPVAIVVFLAGLPVCALLDRIERRNYKTITISLLPDPK